MADANTAPLPWSGRATGRAAETNPGGQQPVPWVIVGVFSPAEAAIVKGRLESQEIPAVIQQEAVGIVYGFTVGPLGSARVLVPESLAGRALAILAETYEAVDEPDDDEISMP